MTYISNFLGISTTKELHGPTITLETNQTKFPFSISVDLTPSIHLPFPRWHPWLKSCAAKRWLSNDVISEITGNIKIYAPILFS